MGMIKSSDLKFDDGRFEISPEIQSAIDKGEDYEALIKLRGYRRLLDFVESKGNEALAVMRGAAMSSDDRLKSNLQLKWTTIEQILRDIQVEVLQSINERKTLISELDEVTLGSFDSINFGDEHNA